MRILIEPPDNPRAMSVQRYFASPGSRLSSFLFSSYFYFQEVKPRAIVEFEIGFINKFIEGYFISDC